MKTTSAGFCIALCASALSCVACGSDGDGMNVGPGNGNAAVGGSSSGNGTGGAGGAASGGSGPTTGSGGQSEPDPSVEVPVKTPVKDGEATVVPETVLGTPMLVTEGVRAALIPSGGIFVVGAGQDVDNNEGFVAAKVTLDGTVHWQKSHSYHEGGTTAVIATGDRYYLGGGKLWAFAPEDGAVEETNLTRPIMSFAVQNGAVVALTTEPLSSEAQRGSTHLVDGVTLTARQVFELPHLEWEIPGPVLRSTASDIEHTQPRSIVSLTDGTFGVQGGVRGHTYLVHLDGQRKLTQLWQSTEDDSRYLNFAGLGRRNDVLTYVTTVDPPGFVEPASWRVARARGDLSGDAWSRSLDPIGGEGNPARGVVVLPSGHILVYAEHGIHILAGETGEATLFEPEGVSISSVLALPDGFLLVGVSADSTMYVAKYLL
jgi:hypothetical protein